MKTRAINGWTKKSMKSAILRGNHGKSYLGDSQNCAYRGEKYNKCGVGVFIPNDLYDDSIEGSSICGLLERYPGLKEFMPLTSYAMGEFQLVHDQARDDENVTAKMVDWINKHVVD